VYAEKGCCHTVDRLHFRDHLLNELRNLNRNRIDDQRQAVALLVNRPR